MTSNNASQNKITVNGDTNGWNPAFQDEVVEILARNGGLKRIRATLQQRLDEAGWSEDLRKYCTALFRSGAATTFDDAYAIITKRISNNMDLTAAEDTDEGVAAPDLMIPNEVKFAARDVVMKEIRAVCKDPVNGHGGGKSTGLSSKDAPNAAGNAVRGAQSVSAGTFDRDAAGSPDPEGEDASSVAGSSNENAGSGDQTVGNRRSKKAGRVSPGWNLHQPLKGKSSHLVDNKRRSGRLGNYP